MGQEGEEPVELDAAELTAAFASPRWLRDAGITSWLAVGVVLLVAGIIALLALTETIVMPLITASIVAAVASPLVRRLAGHRVPRGVGAALVLLGLIVVSVAITMSIVGGVAGQADGVRGQLAGAQDEIEGWAKDLGVSPDQAEKTRSDAGTSVTTAVTTLLNGVARGLSSLSSLIFFLSLTALSLFFLLKDGPQIRTWAERHMGVSERFAHAITQRMLGALRGYFLGVTIVAVFNAVVVSLAAVLLGVPLVGTIAVVTFVGAYIPYLGAWGAGAFSVLVALGGAGTDAAIGMAIAQLLANGILQQLIQPIAYGAALGIHPLAVLVVTIGGGALFGTVGLILAAPVTSAIVRIAADVSRSAERSRAAPEARGSPGAMA